MEIKPHRRLFMFYSTVIFLVLLIFLYIPSILMLVFGFIQKNKVLLNVGIWILIFTLILHVIGVIWARYYVNSMVLIIDDEKVASRRGVIFKTEDIAHYDKIQLVSVRRGLIERMLGLATLEINTAAVGLPGGEVKIKGLELSKAYEIRDIILEKIGKLSEEKRQDVLLRIYNELKEIRKLLEELASKS